MSNLSEHFTLEEMTKSDAAVRLAIDNTPPQIAIDNLRALCDNILEPLRAKIAGPIHITSGFRCMALNTAIGGANKSQHTIGQAADTHVDGMTIEEWYQFIKTSGLPFDQLIQEFNTWVHVSFSSMNRKQCLRAIKTNGQTEYLPG